MEQIDAYAWPLLTLTAMAQYFYNVQLKSFKVKTRTPYLYIKC